MISIDIDNSKKSVKALWSFGNMDSRLMDILEYADKLYHEHHRHVTVTSAWRKETDTVHHYWRAVDIRCRTLPPGVAEDITARINNQFPRLTKSTAILHNVGQGIHIHLQVPV